MKNALILPAVLAICGSVPALANSFTSDSYYVGAQDMPNDLDLVFTLQGAGLTLSSSGTLTAPPVPLNNGGDPFWNTMSVDGPDKNFGNCLYTIAPNPCTGGAPINPSAQYLSNGGASVGFQFFGATGSVTYTTDAAIQADDDQLYWCNSGGCHVLTDGSFTPGTGNFWLKIVDYGIGSFTSNRPAPDGNYYFAVALDPGRSGNGQETANTPEPVPSLLVGTGLMGICFFRRRRPRRAA
jgi:hypothetical protein